MIYDKLESLDTYFKPDSSVYKAVCFARDNAAKLPNGDHEVDGDRLIARVQSYVTQSAEERKFEYHKKYIDVQVMLDGCERQDVASDKELKPIGPFDSVKDMVKCEEPERYSTVILEPNCFVVYFPQDAHRPNCAVTEPEAVRKVCMKVKA